jgi:hypothetical protein
VIQAKWREFATLFKVPQSEWLKLSEGWLTKFKVHNGYKQRVRHGKAGSATSDTVISEQRRIQDITNSYHP